MSSCCVAGSTATTQTTPTWALGPADAYAEPVGGPLDGLLLFSELKGSD
ncbi:hypothetical protein [Streptomyces mirabilis]